MIGDERRAQIGEAVSQDGARRENQEAEDRKASDRIDRDAERRQVVDAAEITDGQREEKGPLPPAIELAHALPFPEQREAPSENGAEENEKDGGRRAEVRVVTPRVAPGADEKQVRHREERDETETGGPADDEREPAPRRLFEQ